MTRTDIEFKASDGTTLRGWLYVPDGAPVSDRGHPCLVMSHGFSAIKEMELDAFAERFSTSLPLACLVYDNRGFGDSDAGPDGIRQEIIPATQMMDMSDAITYAQSREGIIDPNRVGIWGSSFSGGHVLQVGATDRRIKVVLSQVPLVDGWETSNRLVRPDFAEDMAIMYQQDRLARAQGQPPAMVPVVDQDPHKPSALPTPDSYVFFSDAAKKCAWKNEVTLRSVEVVRAHNPSVHIHHISPTPFLMTVAQRDVIAPTDLALEAYSRAREPKQLQLLPGGHFEPYSGPNFERNIVVQIEFLRRHFIEQWP